MKKLSLFLTLSLLTLIGTSTLVKANPAEESHSTKDAVIIASEDSSADEQDEQEGQEGQEIKKDETTENSAPME